VGRKNVNRRTSLGRLRVRSTLAYSGPEHLPIGALNIHTVTECCVRIAQRISESTRVPGPQPNKGIALLLFATTACRQVRSVSYVAAVKVQSISIDRKIITVLPCSTHNHEVYCFTPYGLPQRVPTTRTCTHHCFTEHTTLRCAQTSPEPRTVRTTCLTRSSAYVSRISVEFYWHFSIFLPPPPIYYRVHVGTPHTGYALLLWIDDTNARFFLHPFRNRTVFDERCAEMAFSLAPPLVVACTCVSVHYFIVNRFIFHRLVCTANSWLH
jgi:hypothetical protein